jgi:hypothetical protein
LTFITTVLPQKQQQQQQHCTFPNRSNINGGEMELKKEEMGQNNDPTNVANR